MFKVKIYSRLMASIAVAVSLSANLAWAADTKQAQPQVPAEIAEKVLKNLQLGRPDLKFDDIRLTPIEGVYQVSAPGAPALYVMEEGKFFIAGELFAVAPGQFVNLLEAQKTVERREIMAKLDTSEQIIFSPEGKTKAYVQVFTDVDCGYCRKLHQEVPALNAMGIEVRYLAYPRAGVPSGSYNKIATAWCADNPQQALTDVKNGVKLETKVCEDNPVAKQFALGSKVGVRGTPAIVLADGRLLPGYLPAAALASRLGIKPDAE